jgi:hypothetical protein
LASSITTALSAAKASTARSDYSLQIAAIANHNSQASGVVGGFKTRPPLPGQPKAGIPNGTVSDLV